MQQQAELKQIEFQIDRSQADNFAKQWRHNGLFVPLTDVHCQFATDFANVALKSFIEFCKQQALARLQAMQEAQTAAHVEGA